MTNNKKAALMLGLFFSASVCSYGFTGRESMPKTAQAAASAADIRGNLRLIRTMSIIDTIDAVSLEAAQAVEAQLQRGKELARVQARERAQEEAQKQQELLEQEQAAQQAACAGAQEASYPGGGEDTPVSGDEQSLLASIIFCEAGNQPYEGQVAVGAVIMNRVRSSVFPDTVEEVVYQSGQFTPALTGWLDQVRSAGGYTDAAMQAAADALAGANPIGGCLYFDCGGSGMQIGDHFFH